MNRLGTMRAAVSFSMRNVMICTTGVFDVVGQNELCIPGNRRFRIPLSGHGLLIDPRGVVRPELNLVDEVKFELGRTGLDEGAPGRQSPRARRVISDRAWRHSGSSSSLRTPPAL
jgi:hypothetical protein